MIIVSQYKHEVWNFNNLEIIYVPRETQYEGIWSIKTQDQNGDIYELGNYGTKERAKEVLQEIIEKYRSTETFKAVANRISDQVSSTALKYGFVYEMPLK